jgi:hypothetical protein
VDLLGTRWFSEDKMYTVSNGAMAGTRFGTWLERRGGEVACHQSSGGAVMVERRELRCPLDNR